VNDTFGMGGVKRIGDFDANGNHGVQFHRPARDDVLEGRAVEEFHGDETLVLLLTDFVNGANVGVIQSRGGASFAAETLEGLGVADQIVGEELEGDEPAKRGVLSLVDNPHAASTELFKDAVVGDCFPDEWAGVRHFNCHLEAADLRTS